MIKIDVRRLQVWRDPELEAAVFASQGQTPGDIAGDIPMHKLGKSIRFSVQQYDEGLNAPFISLSAQGHTRCTDKDVRVFLKYIGVTGNVVELNPQTPGTFVRSFKVTYDA